MELLYVRSINDVEGTLDVDLVELLELVHFLGAETVQRPLVRHVRWVLQNSEYLMSDGEEGPIYAARIIADTVAALCNSRDFRGRLELLDIARGCILSSRADPRSGSGLSWGLLQVQEAWRNVSALDAFRLVESPEMKFGDDVAVVHHGKMRLEANEDPGSERALPLGIFEVVAHVQGNEYWFELKFCDDLVPDGRTMRVCIIIQINGTVSKITVPMTSLDYAPRSISILEWEKPPHALPVEVKIQLRATNWMTRIGY
jgi:hypothetical protein